MTLQSKAKSKHRHHTWYTAHVFYRSDIRSTRPRKFHTFEEVYFLVSGVTSSEALQKAKKLAKRKEHSYKNTKGESVSWRMARFVGIQETTDRNSKMVPKFTFDFSKV